MDLDVERLWQWWQWLWQWLLNDAYWYCGAFLVVSIAAEELLAPWRRWRNRDDCIVYGQREDSPVNIRNGRSKPLAPPSHSHALHELLKRGHARRSGIASHRLHR